MRTVIFDIDGVLADIQDRVVTSSTHKGINYDIFYLPELVMKDKPIPSGIMLYHAIMEYKKDSPLEVILLTGRSEKCKAITEHWLAKNNVFKYDDLIMRSEGDHSEDYIYKRHVWLDQLRGKNIIFAIDDQESVANMWIEQGVPCYLAK